MSVPSRYRPNAHAHDLRGYQKAEEASADLSRRMLAEVDRIRLATQDALIDTRGIRAIGINPEALARGVELPPMNDRVVLEVPTPKGPTRLRLLAGAHDQLAEKTGIPRRYYDRMLEGQPALLAENLNTWLRAEPEKRLLRMLRPITEADHKACLAVAAEYTVRAVLSERFRPLDNGALLNVLLPVANEYRAEIKEWNLDESRFFVRLFTSVQSLRDILGPDFARWAKETGGARMGEELLRFGVAIRNSETGHSSLSVSPAVDVRSCTNTLVVTERLRVAHVGRRASSNGNGDQSLWEGDEAEEQKYLQSDTQRLDQAAVFLKVRDRVRYMFSPEQAKKSATVLAEAAGTPLTLPEEIPMMEFVENVGQSFDLQPEELKVLKDEFVHEMAERGTKTPSRFTVSQAFTATAKGISNGHRKQELEEYGWRVLADPVTTLIKLGSVTKAKK